MTTANGGNSEDDTHYPSSATFEEVQCCGHDHKHDEGVPGEAEFHCGGGCCGDNERSDCESNVDPCEDSCCGRHEYHSVHEESTHKKDQQGMERIGSYTRTEADAVCATPDKCCAADPAKLDPDHSGCCDPSTNVDENIMAVRKCIPDGVNGCRRAALLKSTCCGSHGNSTPGAIFFKVFYLWLLLKANGYRNPLGGP